MTTHEELRSAIVASWDAEPKPMSKDRALELAREALKSRGKETTEFETWFQIHGGGIVERMNRG